MNLVDENMIAQIDDWVSQQFIAYEPKYLNEQIEFIKFYVLVKLPVISH